MPKEGSKRILSDMAEIISRLSSSSKPDMKRLITTSDISNIMTITESDHCDTLCNLSSPAVRNDEVGSDEESNMDLSMTFSKDDRYLMPSKSQVLFYLSDAIQLRIKTAGLEFQVTDSTDFPLFDIWYESDCVKSTWIIESYGKTVLLISENVGYSCLTWKKPEPPIIELIDWNGDLFGYFIPGDPFLLEGSDKKTIAKMIAVAKNGRSTIWVCILEGSGREIARLEDYSVIYFSKEVLGFQIKLLTLAAFARIVASQNPPSRSCFCSVLFSLFQC